MKDFNMKIKKFVNKKNKKIVFTPGPVVYWRKIL